MPEQASKAPATSKKQEQSATESVEEAIRRCAYELYLERGGTQESRGRRLAPSQARDPGPASAEPVTIPYVG